METKKQLIEKEAVKSFLENKKDIFNKSLVIFPKQDDYADVVYNNIKYQITTVPADMEEVFGRLGKEDKAKGRYNKKIRGTKLSIAGINMPTIEYGFNRSDVWRDYLNNPISLKKKQYGRVPSSEEIILLIYPRLTSDPPWIKKQLEIAKNVCDNLKFLKEIGFKEIYLIFSNENIRVFP